MTNNSTFSLPAAPPELCFDKNEFAKSTFSVDEFLHAHRNAATMETMRDDLGVYLKVLRSAMIELINEDYADFVNLASNLRGLDAQIGGIQVPLQQLRADIVSVKATLTDTMDELCAGLAEKRSLRGDLLAVQARTKVARSLSNIERLLQQRSDEGNELPLFDQTVLERAAMEYVQVTFELQFCKESAEAACQSDSLAIRTESIHRQLLAALEAHFLHTLALTTSANPQLSAANDAATALERCLRIFCTLDECIAAEQIFRRCCVAKYMHPVIGEQSLQNSPQGVHGIYAQVLAFVEQHMRSLLALTQEGADGAVTVRGFDFLLRSYWPEVEQRLETHMSSIFAPGNPDQFYQRYQSTVEFLRQLERMLGTEAAVVKFHASESYRSFQTRWNLPVYFQIRFQEIGATVETACNLPVCSAATWASDASAPDPQLAPISTAIACFRRCWSDGVYLPQIFQRFWKFALQILARTAHWIDEFAALDSEWQSGGPVAGVPATYADALVRCHTDTGLLVAELPALLALVLAAQRRNKDANVDAASADQTGTLQKCLDETERVLSKCRAAIQLRLIGELVSSSAASLRQVNDIPRMYRKTNRDVPSRAAPYVEQMLRSARQFAGQHGASLSASGDTLQSMLGSVFDQLTAQYYLAVADVLTSVQKTEESLRRLKNLREKAAPNPATAATDQRPLMTDDDKIRLQLRVDVLHWAEAIGELGVQCDGVDRLDELLALVEESTRVKVPIA